MLTPNSHSSPPASHGYLIHKGFFFLTAFRIFSLQAPRSELPGTEQMLTFRTPSLTGDLGYWRVKNQKEEFPRELVSSLAQISAEASLRAFMFISFNFFPFLS